MPPSGALQSYPRPSRRILEDGPGTGQRTLLVRTLDETGWNIPEPARRLDLARSHTYNLVKAFGLDRDDRSL